MTESRDKDESFETPVLEIEKPVIRFQWFSSVLSWDDIRSQHTSFTPRRDWKRYSLLLEIIRLLRKSDDRNTVNTILSVYFFKGYIIYQFWKDGKRALIKRDSSRRAVTRTDGSFRSVRFKNSEVISVIPRCE